MGAGIMRKWLLAFFLILPLAVPVSMIIHHAIPKGTQWELPISGYDPRDLLRGRYIVFQYDLGKLDWNNRAVTQAGDVFCFNGGRTGYSATLLRGGEDRSCDAWIRVKDLMGQQRYYIPESIANRADWLVRANPDKTKALVRITKGQIQLETLLIDGVDIAKFIRDESVE